MRDRNNEEVIFWIVAVDILFMPYWNIVVVPISYAIILWWVIKKYKVILKYDESVIIALSMFLMLVSTIYGSVYNYEYGVVGDNVKRLIQFYFAFGYYFFFKYNFEKYVIDLKKIMWLFVLFVFGFAVLFNQNIGLFSKITQMWNVGNTYNVIMQSSSLMNGVFRYNFIWTDPNNIAYAITGIITFILLYTNTGVGEKIILLAINIYVLVSSMSSGGWICFAISWLACILFKFKSKNVIRRYTSKKSLVITYIVIIAIIALWYMDVMEEVLKSDLVYNALNRLRNNEESRTAIWMRILKGDNIFKYILIGKGSELYIKGISRATHSGHLFWIYAYGFLSYFIFIKEFFWVGLKNVQKYIPLISFFLCFTMNTMVGEQKLLIIFLMIGCFIRRGKINESIS